MKVQDRKINTTTIGAKSTKNFTIAASAKAFKVLSDGLYSDKIATVIRELSTNAVDAQITQGMGDRPFDVWLPNPLNPEFRIRDYGTGLSYEDAMELYSTYFLSTKTDSNEQIGALGLGSKSPFGYTDGFVVVSYFNGEKMIFNCNLSEDGFPTIHHITTLFTDEPNGLEISFAVKESNFHDFEKKARMIWRHFDPLPNVRGYDGDFEVAKRKYICEGTGWKLHGSEDAYSYHDSKCIAVMGLIEYPIILNKLVDIDDNERRLLRSIPLEINFEIGDLEIATNREELGYDTRTSRNIVKRVLAAYEELTAHIQTRFDNCKTLWEARCTVGTISKDYGNSVRDLIESQNIGIQWNGVDIKRWVELDLNKTNVSNEFILSRFSSHYAYRNGTQVVREERIRKSASDHYFNITAHPDDVLIVDDTEKRGAIKKMRHFTDLMRKDKDFDGTIYFVHKASDADLAEVRNAFGGIEVTKLSDLPNPPKRESSVNPSIIDGIRLWDFNFGYFLSNNRWENSYSKFVEDVNGDDIDLADGGIYIPMLRKSPHGTDFDGMYQMETLIKTAMHLGVLSKADTIYGVNHAQAEKLSKTGEWVMLADLVKDAIKKQSTDPKFIANLTTIKTDEIINDVIKGDKHNDINFAKVAALFKYINNELGDGTVPCVDAIVARTKEHKAALVTINKEKINTQLELMRKFSIEPEIDINEDALAENINQFLELFPMFNVVFIDASTLLSMSNTVKATQAAHFISYIKERLAVGTESS